MKIIKLDAIDSTNSYCKELLKGGFAENELIVVAKNQTKGRGQHHTNWLTEPNKNLTFSILIVKIFDFKFQKYLSFCAALAVVKFLEKHHFENVKIKWPNDILADNKKICGILVENLVRNKQIYASIIGIGLNVNQTNFDSHLTSATSMKKIHQKDYDIDACLVELSKIFFEYLTLFEIPKLENLNFLYHRYLYKKDELVFYETKNNLQLSGFVRKVGENGELIIENEFGQFLKYQVKEIKFTG